MPRLDPRLKVVARQIRSHVHADIGSDHGHLLSALLAAGRVARGIAIENKTQPLAHSQSTLAGCDCEVRFGDGLDVLSSGEADSLSICGMGGPSIVKILTRYPDRVPDRVVLQPNQRIDLVRRWGLEAGFSLVDEHFAGQSRVFEVLVFERRGRHGHALEDPAYRDLDLLSAVILGPHHLRRREPRFIQRLLEEKSYYGAMPRLSSVARDRLEAIDRVL